MTVSATLPRVQSTITSGNLTSLASDLSSVTFNITFKYLSTAEVVVTRTDSTGSDTELTETTHYTISPSAGATGTMTFTATGRDLFSANDLLTFTRRMEKAATTFDQLTDYTQNDALDADTLEGNFDKSIMISQQLAEVSSRQIAFSSTATFDSTASKASTITGTAASRQNKLLGFDSAGDISATQDIGTYKGTSATTTTSDFNIRDIVKSSTAGQLNNVYICIKASPSGTALTNTTYWELIIDSYAASSSATTATTKATEASRSEDNAEAYANTAAETAVTVFGASNAADPTQSGTTTDGYSSLHHREKSKEWASSSSNITDDSGSAISPAVKSAKTYASDAATSESNASTSETNAAASATAAAASAAAVASAFDSFDDKFLGSMADSASASSASTTGTWAKNASVIAVASASGIVVGQEVTGTGIPTDANVISIDGTNITISENMAAAGSGVSLTFTGQGVYGAFNGSKDGPATDNDGNALVNGALYFNTTDGDMRVYATSSGTWITASAAQNATVLDYTYTLSGSDATISGSDDNSATLSFSNQESVDVFLNGVKLVPKIGSDANDYHLDTSNTVTLASTAVSGDVILVRVYKTFTVGDAVPASTGGTFSGNVSFGDNNITNVGDIAVDTISSDAGTSIGVTLGTDSGDDFNVGSGKFVVEGDTGRVGIGTSSPTGTAHIQQSSTGISGSNDDVLTLEKDADTTTINMISDTDRKSNIIFSDTTRAQGRVQFDQSNRELTLWTSDASATVTVENNGDATIEDGNLVIGTSGHGIDFSAVSGSHSGSSSSVLDDYEEGVYQPTFSFSTSGSATTSGGSAKYLAYTKIGSLVHLSGSLTVISESSPNGLWQMSIPFTVATLTEQADLGWGNCYWSDHGGDIKNGGILYASEGLNFLYFAQVSDSGTYSYIDNSTLNNTYPKYLRVNITYLTT